jgi:integrase
VKNKRRHSVPLSRQALELIESMPQLGDAVFTARSGKPVANFSDLKIAVDALMKSATPFVWHDLRRTTASNLARLGVQLPVIEKCLNHTGGSFRGIVAVYQKHTFMPEMRAALSAWADGLLDRLVQGKPLVVEEDSNKIVRLRRA